VIHVGGRREARGEEPYDSFTIESEHNITAHGNIPASADKATIFTSESELAKITSEWAMPRLVDTWNSFAGVAPFTDLKPVKKFTTRAIAVRRIYNAVGRLLTGGAQPAADVAPMEAKARNTGRRDKRIATGRTATKASKAKGGVKAGRTFERKFKGKTYTLITIERDERVVFQLKGGKVFTSLTAAAKAVTNYPSISGVAFWGDSSAMTAGTERT
jgi:hypothetical protein